MGNLNQIRTNLETAQINHVMPIAKFKRLISIISNGKITLSEAMTKAIDDYIEMHRDPVQNSKIGVLESQIRNLQVDLIYWKNKAEITETKLKQLQLNH